MKDKEILAIGEQSTIAALLLQTVKRYDGFPPAVTQDKIFWQALGDTESVGIYSLPGAVVLQRFISGSFKAQFPFCVRYICKPTNNPERVGKQSALDGLGEWLEDIGLPDLADGRTVEAMERTQTSYLADRDAAGNEVYQCNFVLRYVKKN